METLRRAHYNNMQEFLDPAGDAKDRYERQINAQEERRRQAKESFYNRLKEDSPEQIHYNNVIESIVDYDNYYAYKHRFMIAFKKRIYNFFRIKRF